MLTTDLTASVRHARKLHDQATAHLVDLLIEISLKHVRAVLPDAARLDLRGMMNKDRGWSLRIQGVADSDGTTIFDVVRGANPEVDAVIDEVNTEYLDQLIGLTGDTFIGHHSIGAGTQWDPLSREL